MRYEGQSYELTVDMDPGSLSADEFHRRYRDVYGYSDEGTPLEILQLRLLVQVPTSTLRRDGGGAAGTGSSEPVEHRSVRYQGDTIAVPVYRRAELPEVVRIDGPAVLVQYDTTTFVTPDFVFWREAGTGNVRGEMRK
jgi:N-methylhydantoinase A